MDREGNKILFLKTEIFFERALKALYKDVPVCYLPSFDDDDADQYSNKQLKYTDLFLTYEQWTNYMIDKVRRFYQIIELVSFSV